jgi:hypothetical protein
MGPKALCMPDRKKLSQPKASKLCRDGAAEPAMDRGSATRGAAGMAADHCSQTAKVLASFLGTGAFCKVT